MSEKDPRAATSPSQRPRSPRVPVEFGLEVEGKTPAGESFRIHGQAIRISRGGATIILDADVALGTIVKLMPPYGREVEAEVNGVWVDRIDGSRRIGVKLIADDGWFAE